MTFLENDSFSYHGGSNSAVILFSELMISFTELLNISIKDDFESE